MVAFVPTEEIQRLSTAAMARAKDHSASIITPHVDAVPSSLRLKVDAILRQCAINIKTSSCSPFVISPGKVRIVAVFVTQVLLSELQALYKSIEIHDPMVTCVFREKQLELLIDI